MEKLENTLVIIVCNEKLGSKSEWLVSNQYFPDWFRSMFLPVG